MGVYPGQLVVVVCIRGQGWSVARLILIIFLVAGCLVSVLGTVLQ